MQDTIQLLKKEEERFRSHNQDLKQNETFQKFGSSLLSSLNLLAKISLTIESVKRNSFLFKFQKHTCNLLK